MVLGQVQTEEKSNEITAIPALLSKLDIAGCIVTIDAMGCQKDIAKSILDSGADYVLALKDNQKGLRKEVADTFEEVLGQAFDDCEQRHLRTVEKGHGRTEIRDYWIVDDMRSNGRKTEWPGLSCFGKVTSTRTVGEETSVETRYFITSLPRKVKAFAHAVRAHWAIENTLHWSLDVTFREDDSRTRKGNAAANMAVLRRFVLSAIRHTEGIKKKISIKSKRKFAGWDHPFLLRVLGIFDAIALP